METTPGMPAPGYRRPSLTIHAGNQTDTEHESDAPIMVGREFFAQVRIDDDSVLPARTRADMSRPVGVATAVQVRLRWNDGPRARGCQSTISGRNLCTAGAPACPRCSGGTANGQRNSLCSGSRRIRHRDHRWDRAAMRASPGRRSGQSATRFTCRRGSTPALTSSS